MKSTRFFTALALSGFLLAGALFVGKGAEQKVRSAKAATDIGEIEIKEVRNAISTDLALYLLPTKNYDLPDSWDYGYAGVGEEDGVFLNGVKQVGAVLKYANTGSAYITFYYGLPRAAVEGDVLEFKGTFESVASGYSFIMNYATQRFAETWVHALEDYDIVSLKDANMPDLGSDFVSPNNNTDAKFGGEAAYVTDSAGLPKQKGFFGLTNSTGSYAFQFYYEKASGNNGWFNVLIGASGTLYSQGHFIDFGFLDDSDITGRAQIHEYVGSGTNWGKNLVQESNSFYLNWNAGQKNLLEIGVIKVRDFEDLHFVFFKCNGALKFGEYWELEDGGMTTKVCMVNATGTTVSVTNSIEPIGARVTSATYIEKDRQLYFSTPSDVCPAFVSWSDYFMPVQPGNLTYNGDSIGYSNWNYFKKTGSTQFFLELGGDLGITPVAGDVLYVGGMFKAARLVNGVKTLFEVNFAETYLQYFGGEKWSVINPSYEAADFSKDLLKMTLPVCSTSSSGNHDALEEIWAILADEEHYGSLALDQKDALIDGVADPSIEVPTSAEEIEDMLPEEAIGAALYRYDYCTAKYKLDSFIEDRPEVPNLFSNYNDELIDNNSNNTIMILVIVASLALLSSFGLIVFKKKRAK